MDYLASRARLRLLSSVIAFTPLLGHALGFRNPNQDAEATARGNAYVATANTPAALYYNPAGITQLPGYHVQFGLYNTSVNSDYRSFTGQTVETEFEILSVPQLYATFTPTNHPFSYGLGLYAPFGLGLEWPDDNPFRELAIEGRLAYISLTPVIAWEPIPGLSIAAGPSLNYSKAKLRTGLPPLLGGELEFNGDNFGFGYVLGLLWQPHPKWSFGAKYNSATTLDLEGHLNSSSPFFPRTTTSAELDFPQFVAAGVSFRPTPNWNLEVNVDWTDWDTLNTVGFKNTAIQLPFNWESSFLYHFGATRYFPNGYFLSAGYFYSENSTSEKNFNPIVPDTDLHVGSFGFGYKGPHWSWALSSQIITGPSRTVRGSQSLPSASGQTADGKYQWFNTVVNVSVGYHF